MSNFPVLKMSRKSITHSKMSLSFKKSKATKPAEKPKNHRIPSLWTRKTTVVFWKQRHFLFSSSNIDFNIKQDVKKQENALKW